MNERMMRVMNVTKTELIEQLVENHNYTKKAATEIVEDFTSVIVENLRNGNSVSLRGFGNFEILERKARSCPNPKTGETVHIPTHSIPRFYPGKQMRLAVKFWEDDNKRSESAS